MAIQVYNLKAGDTVTLANRERYSVISATLKHDEERTWYVVSMKRADISVASPFQLCFDEKGACMSKGLDIVTASRVIGNMETHVDTPDGVIKALARAYHQERRVRIWLGDNVTGQTWNEENDVTGKIGHSTGNPKLYLLINSARSMGGGAILTHCIVHMVDTKTKQVLYSHKLFKMPEVAVKHCTAVNFPRDVAITLSWCVLIDGQQHAYFETQAKAQRYAAFMCGERMGK